MITIPLVSVVLPFYNSEATLAGAIDSILNQSFSEFELLLIDNNSSDNSPIIAQDFGRRDKRISILLECRQGVDFAMNCGLKNARGKYIARMDADDISHPERLKKQVRFLNENSDYGLVGSYVSYVSHIRRTNGFIRFVNWVNSFHSANDIECKQFIEIPVVNPTIMLRRKLYEMYGGCRQGNFPEDYEMLLRYLDAGVRMAKLPEPLLEWHDYSSRLTRNDERYSKEAFFRTKAAYLKNWSLKNNPEHPVIWVWGAGRKTRQRARLLELEGLIIRGYIDIVKKKDSKERILHFSEIPPPGQSFIVSMVGRYGAQEKIRKFLLGKQYKEMKNFIFLA